MIRELEKVAVDHGDRLKVISAKRLKELREVIENFKDQQDLNDFQKWIVNELYQFEIPEEEFEVNSIVLAAVHHPFYARAEFQRDGIKKTFLCLVRSDFDKTEAYLREFAEAKGFSIKAARNLPMKRLGAHSGLAKYGRNNITYVDGLGSNFSYAAYFSNVKCEEDTWGDVRNAEACSKCDLCVKNCPTKAIREEVFLIDNQKCLSCMNEVPGEFPDWIPVSVHHTLYDCLICQRVCPMNRKEIGNIIEHISFTEEETKMLLEGTPIHSFSDEFKAKIFMLGIDEWYEAIPRNLRVLFEQ